MPVLLVRGTVSQWNQRAAALGLAMFNLLYFYPHSDLMAYILGLLSYYVWK